jgi:hypothetical protein
MSFMSGRTIILATLTLLASFGAPLTPWMPSDYAAWRKGCVVQRSYSQDVAMPLKELACEPSPFQVQLYGTLGNAGYPLLAVRSREWLESKPCALVTGGVHGYETSGVMGALDFLRTDEANERFAKAFNIVVVPCVSPWSYEHVQRWNEKCIDPNRSFGPDGVSTDGGAEATELAEEAVALKALIESLGVDKWTCHLDLHETTDADEAEYRPAAAARDGELHVPEMVPDGFYLVADAPARALLLADDDDCVVSKPAWLATIVQAVGKVTHIAEEGEDRMLAGMPVVQPGVVAVPTRSLGVAAAMTNAPYAATTEVYPDSQRVSDAGQCNRAQVAACLAALNHVIEEEGLLV